MKIALHSVSYSGTWGGQTRLSLRDFIRKAKDLGYDGIELAAKRPHASPLDLKPRHRSALKKAAADAGLDICALASYHDWAGGWDHRDMAHVEKELVYFAAVVRLAADLEVPIVRTYTGFGNDSVPYRQQWDQVVIALREACRRAADHGVLVGIQNHSCIASHPDSLLDLIADIGEPNAKMVLDAPIVVDHDEPLRETVLKCGDLIAHSHLTDFARRTKYRYVPETVTYEENGQEMVGVVPGHGRTDFREFVGALAEIGYDGWLAYEMCSPLAGGGREENLDRCAKETLDYMRGLLSEVRQG
jgi:sugar phosphate isomerase/epimerase